MPRGEVALLADILRDVVEFQLAVFVPLDEFPVAIADRAMRRAPLIAIVCVMLEERLAAVHRSAVE